MENPDLATKQAAAMRQGYAQIGGLPGLSAARNFYQDWQLRLCALEKAIAISTQLGDPEVVVKASRVFEAYLKGDS